MNRFTKFLVGAALLLAASAGFGQTALTYTRLSAAISSTTATSVSLASVTGVLVGSILYVEDGTGGARQAGEAMFVVSVPTTGTLVGVVRGYDQTIPNPHISGAPVIVAPVTAFYEYEPSGGCTATAQQFTPYINLKTGNQWICSSVTSSWVPGWFNYEAPPGVSAAVASVAGATKPSGPLFHVTGALAITAWGSTTAIGLDGGGGSVSDAVGAPFCIIPDAAFTTTATNNIALASTAVINKLLCYTFDQTNKKYVPTY